MEFGRWLAERREAVGLKRREAAKKAKVPESTWRDLETGRKESIGGIRLLPNPSAEVLGRVADALELSLDEVMKHVGRVPGRPRPAKVPDNPRSALDAKVSRLSPRDRRIVDLLVDALLDDRDA